VRDWLTLRCILIALLLVAAPGAALAHLLVTWAPSQLELLKLDRGVARDRHQLDAYLEQSTRLQQQTARLHEQAVAAEAYADWLPERDRNVVFDRLAEALRDERVAIEQLALGEPTTYTAVSWSNLLACEQVTIVCTGDYAGLTACLDRICELDLPVRFRELSWNRTGRQLTLSLQLRIPFVPDDALRELLAAEANLVKENDEP
jgi:hypothetical protein